MELKWVGLTGTTKGRAWITLWGRDTSIGSIKRPGYTWALRSAITTTTTTTTTTTAPTAAAAVAVVIVGSMSLVSVCMAGSRGYLIDG